MGFMTMKALFLAAVSLPLLAAASPPTHAQSFTAGEAHNAVRSGDIIPLKDIFAMLKERYGGYQLDAGLFSTSGGGSEYRIEWMTDDGRRLRVVVNAQTGRIERTSGD